MVPRRTDIPLPMHAFAPGRARPALPPVSGDKAWDYGVDLFNARFYWEAHEVWEGLWRTLPRGSAEWVGTKALIQTAAALYKIVNGNPAASRRIAARAARALGSVGEGSVHGLGVQVLARRARAIAGAESPVQLDQVAFEIE